VLVLVLSEVLVGSSEVDVVFEVEVEAEVEVDGAVVASCAHSKHVEFAKKVPLHCSCITSEIHSNSIVQQLPNVTKNMSSFGQLWIGNEVA
jgi:hypothetical protein